MGMSDRLRREFARQVSVKAAVDLGVSQLFSVRDNLGRRVVVPVLDTDSVHLAATLVQKAGGKATLVVRRKRAGRVCPALVKCTVRARVSDARGDHHLPVGGDCTIADVLKILAPGSAITMSPVEDDGEELRLADVVDSELPGDLTDEFVSS